MDNHHQTQLLDSQPRSGGQNKRPRGRPVGSKNKPKPPKTIIIRERFDSFSSHLLQIPPNYDVVEALTDFTIKRQLGICILSATGSLTTVALKHLPNLPTTTTLVIPTVLNFTGRFQILSLLGAILPPPAPPSATGLSVFFSNVQGQVMGGKVMGPLLSAETVIVSVSSFVVTNYERLPLVEENVENKNLELTLPCTGGKFTTSIPQKTQTIKVMNPASTVSTLFHDGGVRNVMPGEELWGDDAPVSPTPRTLQRLGVGGNG